MTSAYEPPLNSDYLLVKLKVSKDGEKAFRDGMAVVKDSVFRDRLHWHLLRAGKRIGPDADDDTHVHYLHLWQTNHPIDVWEGQFTVASDSPYAALYRAIDYEEQNILRVPAIYCPTKAFAEPAKCLLLVHELPLAKDWSQVLDWQWTLPVAVGNDDAAPTQFSLSFAFQSVTGVLRTHFHFFESDTLSTTALTEPYARERIDLGALARPRNVAVDKAPALRAENRIGISSDKAVKQRTGIELYARETYGSTDSHE
jgi:hypothetical protein